MNPGWLAAGVAFALGAAIAILALPDAPEEIAMTSVDEAEVALEQIRSTGIAELPTWRVGDAWRVQFNEGDPICWMVVADVGEAYRQGVACEDGSEAIAVDLAVSRAPFVGTFTHEIEGIGDPDADATRWYDWPLSDGKSWTTTYGETDVSVSALLVDGRFQLTMTYDDGSSELARYDYDPALRWWSEIRFESGYVFRVHERATAWSGPVAVATADLAALMSSQIVTGSTSVFTAGGDDDYIVLIAQRPTNAVEYWDLTGPNGASRTDYAAPLARNPTSYYELIPATPGEWTYREVGMGAGRFDARIFLSQVEIVEM